MSRSVDTITHFIPWYGISLVFWPQKRHSNELLYFPRSGSTYQRSTYSSSVDAIDATKCHYLRKTPVLMSTRTHQTCSSHANKTIPLDCLGKHITPSISSRISTLRGRPRGLSSSASSAVPTCSLNHTRNKRTTNLRAPEVCEQGNP